MKVLTKLLLIHWHYFINELIEFEKLNFLTGKNSSGKSTIVDALQLILLGDTSGSYFNKAASKKGERTLKGYLLCELGDDENSGNRCLRSSARFTSYIVLEFYDKEKSRFFTAGCCFDVYSENDIPRLFFLYDGQMHPQRFISGGAPMDITALRVFLKDSYNGRYETTDVGRDFRIKLYGRLGGLRDRFSGLLKKAVSFDPEMNIQDFISDFVCDSQQIVDVSHMQENIRSYKRLEAEASVLNERISLLDQIDKTYEIYTDARKNETLYSFLIDRATADMKNTELYSERENAQKTAEQLEAVTTIIADIKRQLGQLRGQRDTLNAELLSDGTAQALDQIVRQIIEKEQRINILSSEYEKMENTLVSYVTKCRARLKTMLDKIDISKVDLPDASILSRVRDIYEEDSNLLQQFGVLENIDALVITRIGEAGLSDISAAIDNHKTRAIKLNSRLNEEHAKLEKRRGELMAEQRLLESGIFPFPQDALDLKDSVISRLRTIAKKDINVRIIAETAEILNERWRNVIEGYLHTQKYNIIVPEEYFRDALDVFNTIKRSKTVYGTGIVDIEKLRRINPVVDAGSLAEEIETDDADVRAFLDFTLGRVQKCESVKDLRRYRTSITDEGMLYQSFVVRAMNPERWKVPAIGKGAIKRRLEAVKNEIIVLTEQTTVCAGIITGLDAASSLSILSSSEIERIVLGARNMALIPELREDLLSLEKNRESIDTTKIDLLKLRITDLDENIRSQDDLARRESSREGELTEKHRRLRDETIPKLARELESLEAEISARYDDEWVTETGAPRYSKELSSRGKAVHIAAAFPREQSRAINIKEKTWEELLDFRREYNEKYKMGFDVKAYDNDVYRGALLELSNNKLPEYQTRISDAKLKALEQFQEDFISRLQNNINGAKRQIEDLNRVLRGVSFAEDTYRFRVIPKPDYKRFHDMIVDEMITQGGYNLFTLQFNEKYKEEIAELFAIITNEDGIGGGSSGYEKRVHEFTDFRTYLSFDLEVEGYDGKSQRLSKTHRKKSGGETQTPFYIAVLASFAQLYREGRDKTNKTSRLIIFDEAFSKMDGERIVRSIELLRKFDFQAILSAPPDKIVDIATLVDRTLCVHREGTNVSVFSFDAKQANEYAEEIQ